MELMKASISINFKRSLKLQSAQQSKEKLYQTVSHVKIEK